MEDFSKCAIGAYYYTGILDYPGVADDSAIYTHSLEEDRECSLGYLLPVILKDRDTDTWIGTVRKFCYMIYCYCIPYK